MRCGPRRKAGGEEKNRRSLKGWAVLPALSILTRQEEEEEEEVHHCLSKPTKRKPRTILITIRVGLVPDSLLLLVSVERFG